jgi:hypothetical protein
MAGRIGTVLYVSFLVRLWREPGVPALPLSATWHAEVEHIQTGRKWRFDSADELLDFLRRLAENPGEPGWSRAK